MCVKPVHRQPVNVGLRNKTNLAFTLGFRVMGFPTGGIVTLGVVFREITIILL